MRNDPSGVLSQPNYVGGGQGYGKVFPPDYASKWFARIIFHLFVAVSGIASESFSAVCALGQRWENYLLEESVL